MKSKKKICPSCGFPSFIWSTKYGCQDCTARAKLSTQTPKKQGAGLKKVADKRARQLRVYSGLKTAFLLEHQNCAVYPERRALFIHHKKHRENERLNDFAFWLAVSQEGHDYIHAHPEEAYEKGWLIKG